MENKYKEGEVVYDRVRPNQNLIIKRYYKGVYYCVPDERANGKELIYLVGDLMTRTQKVR